MSKLVDYIKETKAEMSHVSWPTKRQAVVFTALVIVFSFGVAFYIGLFDYVFSWGIKSIIQ